MVPGQHPINADVKFFGTSENTIGSQGMTFEHHQNIRSVDNDVVEPIQDHKDSYRRNSVTAKNGRGGGG